MNGRKRMTPTDRERRVESLLQTAAEYEPESPMPTGMEARALARRAPKRQVTALSWQPFAGVSSLGLMVGALWVAFSYQHRPESVYVRQPATFPAALQAAGKATRVGNQVWSDGKPVQSVSISNGAERDKSDRTHRRKSSPAGSTYRKMIFANASAVEHRLHPRPAGRLSLQAVGFKPSLARHLFAQDKPIDRKTIDIYHARQHGFAGRAEKHPVWRTEIVETETVGFASFALLARENREQQTITLAPTLVAYPVQDSDVFCSIHARASDEHSEPIHSTKPGEIDENH